MTEKSGYFVLKEEHRNIIKSWWESLEQKKGERAHLRRCENPTEVIFLSGFIRLLKELKDIPQQRIHGMAAVAGLLSHIKENVFQIGDKYISFGQQLGLPKGQGEKPTISETRFYQLQKCRNLDDLYRILRRTIMMLDQKVNILSLADCVLHWEKENSGDFEKEPNRRFHFRMAQDYFSSIDQKQ